MNTFVEVVCCVQMLEMKKRRRNKLCTMNKNMIEWVMKTLLAVGWLFLNSMFLLQPVALPLVFLIKRNHIFWLVV